MGFTTVLSELECKRKVERYGDLCCGVRRGLFTLSLQCSPGLRFWSEMPKVMDEGHLLDQ